MVKRGKLIHFVDGGGLKFIFFCRFLEYILKSLRTRKKTLTNSLLVLSQGRREIERWREVERERQREERMKEKMKIKTFKVGASG